MELRSLTGPDGAIAWINAQFLGTPWENPDNGLTIRWIVVHLLPGLYGPDSTIAAVPDLDQQSFLRFNGESFPIQLPKGVSLQGTSALDTILDARGTATAVIEAGGHVPILNEKQGYEPQDHFVDGVTIRGARSGSADPRSGAGVYISGSADDIHVTVSNCFIVDNDAGIAIESLDGLPARPTIVNNTIAWNAIGIWCGERGASGNAGTSSPTVHNNIIDTRAPSDPDELQRSAFVGLSPADLTVAAETDDLGTILFGSTVFNAWPVGREYVLGALTPANWPLVTLSGSPSVSTTFDIAAFMGDASTPRGILYVNDAFRASPVGDISPHDFRLSPHSAQAGVDISPSNPIAFTNPMVDIGRAIGDTRSPGRTTAAFTMANGNVIDARPVIRLSGLSADDDVFHAWDWDTDGFGNPRIRCRTGFTALARIDLGADELDELLVAGYVPGTRMFAVVVDEAADIVNTQTAVYFFNLRGSAYPRPFFNGTVGDVYNWWVHSRLVTPAEGCPDCVTLFVGTPATPVPTNFTNATTRDPGATFLGATWRSTEINLAPTALPYPDADRKPPIMRNLACDFSPLLLSDIPPFWGESWFNSAPVFGSSLIIPDIYAANPWWGDRHRSITQGVGTTVWRANDNWNAYFNPSHPTTFGSQVVTGHIHPPGTTLGGPSTNCGDLPSYLVLPVSAFAQFGPFAPCAPSPSSTYTVGPWGFGDDSAGCPDLLPLFVQWQGLRWNLQVRRGEDGPLASNLQTFLAVIGDEPFEIGSGAGASRQAHRYPGERLDIAARFPRASGDAAVRRILIGR